MTQGTDYDYVIVGAGSAGCTLAARLTEDGAARVLVLEAGGWDRDFWIHLPLGWGKLLFERRHDWMYATEPEANVGGRVIECARGKVIGGCSSINAMGYVRGHRSDYDRWAEGGLPDWSYRHVLPYFRRQESWQGGASDYRGGDGPLVTRETIFRDPLVDAYIAAGRRLGHPVTADYNGAQQEGFALPQWNIRNGRRCSTAVAYLRPAMARGRTTVAVGALATRILFDGHRATGVAYLQDGEEKTAEASREVILAGGVINSPQLLMLSGIGDPAALRRHDIAVRAALPGVGRNLQDHLSVGIDYRRKETGAFVRMMRLDRLALELGKGYFLRTGLATDLPMGLIAFLRSAPEIRVPDIQFLFRAAPLVPKPYLPPFTRAVPDGFGCRAVVLRPESRGTIALRSADPRAPVRIHQNFLATDGDWRAIRAGLGMVRDIARQPELAPFIGAEIAPGLDKTAQSEIDAHIRAVAATAHHPLGTCKMGADSDPAAVVDPELKVRGVEGLRVIDASVMPDLIGGNINAAVVMVAEKAADLIRGRAPPAPARV